MHAKQAAGGTVLHFVRRWFFISTTERETVNDMHYRELKYMDFIRSRFPQLDLS